MLLSLITPPEPEFENTVSQIIKSPEYAHLRSGLRDFIARVKEAIGNWLLEMLERTFSNIQEPAPISDKLSTIFIIIGILVIVAIIIIIIVKMSNVFEKKGRIKEILGERIDEGTTPESLRNKASASMKEGDFRQAVRYDFIALLLLMHEKRILYLDETKTNAEIYNFLKKKNFSRLNIFKFLIDTFNSSWYGHKLSSREVYDEWGSSINILWNEVINFEDQGK